MLQGGFSWAKEALMVVGILIAALGAIILGAPATVALVVAGIVAAVGTLVVLIKEHWDSIVEGVSGVWEKVSEIFSDLWEDIKEIWESVSAWFDETVITPVCDFFTDLYKDVSKYFSDLWEDIKGVWSSVSTWFSTNVIEPITSFFKGIYDDVSKWFKTTVSPKLTATYWTDKFSGIKDGMKSAMNSVISHVESAINKIIRALNNLSIKLPEFLGGGTIGFNISEVKLPRLAQGSVVNPGHEFAAILGDNRYEQEVVSPLSTMKQAFIEALAESGYSNSGRPVVLQIDGTTFARITNPYMAKENTRIGIKAMGV
jgi:phage-related protein